MSSVVQQQVPERYKQTEVGVIPEDWECIESSEAIKYFGGYGFSSRLAASAGVKWLKIANVGLNEIKWDAESYLPEHLRKEFKSYELKNDDVVMALTRPILSDKLKVARVGDNDTPALLNQRVARLDAQPFHKIDYLFYVVQRLNFVAAMNLSMAGTDPPNIGTVALGKIKIAVPSSPVEQTAIANALSDVDALITSLEKIIAKKRAIKTAAMQQLLTGKKRLPPFDQTHTGYKHTELGEIPEDWEVKPLSSVLKENPRYGIGAAAVPLARNLPVYLRITDISEDGYFKPTTKVGVDRQDADDYVLQKGDLVFARTGASVGKTYLYRESDGKLVYAGFLIKVSPDPKKLNFEFLFQYVSTNSYWNWVQVMSMRSGQPGINGAEYGQMLLPIPIAEEQIGIANILSDMDKDIKAIDQRLNKTQQLKQGMMQELLTGRTRLV